VRNDARVAVSLSMDSWLTHLAFEAGNRSAGRIDAPRWESRDSFQLGPERSQSIALLVDDKPEIVPVILRRDGAVDLASDADEGVDFAFSSYVEHLSEPGTLHVIIDGSQTTLRKPTYDASDIEDGAASGAVRAPINGRVAKLFVGLGAVVAKGDKVAVVEAMKMEHVITAAVAGTVDKMPVSEGAQVNQGALLAHILAEG
jgi:3-methylcrotonyl-CoA carboxylase alpha subunit